MYNDAELNLAARFLGLREKELRQESDDDLKSAYALINKMDQGFYDRQTLIYLRERFNVLYPKRRLKNGCMSCLKGQIVYSESLLQHEITLRTIISESVDAAETRKT